MSEKIPVIKAIVIGDSTVGKSALLMNYTEGIEAHADSSITTIGVDFKNKVMNIKDKKIKLQIWDTAGQERFRTIAISYYRKAQGIVLVFDVSNRESFEHLQSWMDSISENADENVSVILIGNKCDLEHKVQTQEIQQIADEYKIPLFLTSAKTGENVAEAFYKITQLVLEKQEIEKHKHEENSKIQEKTEKEKHSGCCN